METLVGIALIAYAIYTIKNLGKDKPMKDKEWHFFDANEASRQRWENQIRQYYRDNSIEAHTFVEGIVGNNWCLLNTGLFVFKPVDGKIGKIWFFPYEEILDYRIIPNGHNEKFWYCRFQLANKDGSYRETDYVLPVWRAAQVEDDIKVSFNRYKKEGK